MRGILDVRYARAGGVAVAYSGGGGRDPRHRGVEADTAGDARRKPAGIAVHVGARAVSAAGPGEVLVSGTVRDLVAGSDVELVDRGVHKLKGVPGPVQIYAVVP